MFGASFLALIWIAWAAVTTIFVVLMIWKSVIGVPADSFVIFGAAQRQADNQHRATVARAERLTRLSKYCGFASLGLLLVSGALSAAAAHRKIKGLRKSD